MSYLLVDEGRALLLDAGTGVGRLAEPLPAAVLARCESLDVLLTHYHLDHVVGLSSLPAVWERPVRLWGPRPPLVDAAGPEVLADLLAPPFFSTPLPELVPPVEVLAYDGPRLEIGPFDLRLRRQPHPGGSVGVRVGDGLAYVTDTEEDEATVPFVAGVRTLLHEVWDLEADTRGQGHSSTTGVAAIADAAGVGRLVPVHHKPTRDSVGLEELFAELTAAAVTPVAPAVEGETFDT